jgi:hypothetical protein
MNRIEHTVSFREVTRDDKA